MFTREERLRTLRQQPDLEHQHGNSIFRVDKLLVMFNKLVTKHRTCLNSDFTILREDKQALGSVFQFKCVGCGYNSEMLATYKTVQDGKGADINMLLALAMQDTSAGKEKTTLPLT